MQEFYSSLVELLSMSPVIYLSGVLYTSSIFKWMRDLVNEDKGRSEWVYIGIILINGLIPTIIDAFSLDLFNRVNPAVFVIGIPVLAVFELSIICRDRLRIYVFLASVLMLQLSCLFGFAASFITFGKPTGILMNSPSLHTSVLTLSMIILGVSFAILRTATKPVVKLLKEIIHDDLYGSTIRIYMILNGIVLAVTTGVDYNIYFTETALDTLHSRIQAEKMIEAFRTHVLAGMTLRYLLILATSLVILYVQCKMEIGRRKALEISNHLHKEKKLNEILEKQANTDALTGLFNRQGMVEMIQDTLAESSAEDMHALIMLDLDHFKEINDNFGHPIGDDILTKASAAIKGAFRENDIVGRLGGDEFCVFMIGCTEDIAIRKAQYLNQMVRFSHTDGVMTVNTTVSIGVSMYPNHGTDYDTLYHSADKALYKTKERGRNGYTMSQGDV